MDFINTVYSIIILVFSVVIHEVAHGYTALFLGDPTAKYEKRLTLNPLKHLDPVGSVIIPIVTSLAGVAFGWAKPVPYNPYNLRNPKWGAALIAIAGPISNLVIAILCALVLRYASATLALNEAVINLLVMTIIVNIGLMVFNLTPLYPLDGSKILFAFIPYRYQHIADFIMRYSLPLFLIFVLFFSRYWSGVVEYIVRLLLWGI